MRQIRSELTGLVLYDTVGMSRAGTSSLVRPAPPFPVGVGVFMNASTLLFN